VRGSVRSSLGFATAVAGAAFLVAADRPSILGQTQGGLWELSGAPGRAPVRQCLPDTLALSQPQHLEGKCSRTIVRDLPTRAEVNYSCPAGDFGQTSLLLITPRSLRVQTQGIAHGAPFHYVLQARRVGDC
jgi:hypothetical protein